MKLLIVLLVLISNVAHAEEIYGYSDRTKVSASITRHEFGGLPSFSNSTFPEIYEFAGVLHDDSNGLLTKLEDGEYDITETN